MRKLFILGMIAVCLLVSSPVYAGPLETLRDQGLLRISQDGSSVMLYIEYQLYKQMTYNQKAGMCAEAIKNYGAKKVYGFKMGASSAFDMLFAFDQIKGFRVYR